MSTAAYDTAPHHAVPAARATPRRTMTPGWTPGRPAATRAARSSRHRPRVLRARIYRGRTVDELIPTIVAELGEDAVVLRHHRGLTGGFAGFFQKSFVEIEARRGDPGGSLLDRYDEDGAAPALPGDGASVRAAAT